ncbi:NAD-dependent epimerase/dehydratase family protein [Lactiplantibacillus pingfangensis]|uniref:NAD-dependent epimerase/dehydratase family protein n=1 Tax=Lactiplantibacillus pingfangensis TaxID=2559915 RepID=UPI0010F71CC0|nr:NAD-dependent epimerase/dehydratase family protein [Lactiplantibacillus pingfangensis]
MKKAVVLGGAGHIGSYLVPMLVKAGYAVTSVTRGKHQPYVTDRAWRHVEHLYLDRSKDSQFAAKVAAINADVVIDLISFTLVDTQKMVAALKATKLSHYLFCSSVWAHGRAETLPADPNGVKHPLDEYGKQKYASEQYLKQAYLETGFPATVIMPGQISGPGWIIMSPLANGNTDVFQQIADGQAISLPNFGMETLHLVHASDVAQVFFKAVTHRNQALGESFHAVGTSSLTLYGYALAMYRFFDTTPQINFLPWDAWKKVINNPVDVDKTYYHIARSGQYSIANAQKLLDYQPQYTPIEVAEIAVQSYLDRGIIHHA